MQTVSDIQVINRTFPKLLDCVGDDLARQVLANITCCIMDHLPEHYICLRVSLAVENVAYHCSMKCHVGPALCMHMFAYNPERPFMIAAEPSHLISAAVLFLRLCHCIACCGQKGFTISRPEHLDVHLQAILQNARSAVFDTRPQVAGSCLSCLNFHHLLCCPSRFICQMHCIT